MLLFREIGRCRRHFRRELDRVNVEIVDCHDLASEASHLENTSSNHRVNFNEVHHHSLVRLESDVSLKHRVSAAVRKVTVGINCDLVQLIAAHIATIVLADLAKLLRNISELNSEVFTDHLKL